MPSKVRLVKAIVFPVVMYGCVSWTIKKAEHWRIYAFELWCWRRLLRVLDFKEIQAVHPKGNQSWIFIGRTDAEAETPPDAKSWLIWKDPDAGKDWRREEKTEDEMAGWHHWLDGRESEWTPGVGDGQGGLACCNSWGRKESDTTEQLNWTELMKQEASLGARLFLILYPRYLTHGVCSGNGWLVEVLNKWCFRQIGIYQKGHAVKAFIHFWLDFCSI